MFNRTSCWLFPFLRLWWTLQVICLYIVCFGSSRCNEFCTETLSCTCGLCLLTNDVAYFCRSFVLLVVSARLCDILSVCLPDMESRCLITHVLLCWEHPAHLSSNELHETDCFFILHLTLQQKCLNKTVFAADGICLPLQGSWGTNCLNEVFEGGVMIFLR